jgi:hypothetical protein
VCFSPKDRSVYSNIQALKKKLSPVEMALFFFFYDFLLFAGEIKLRRSLIPNTYELSPTAVADFNTDTQKTGNCLFFKRCKYNASVLLLRQGRTKLLCLIISKFARLMLTLILLMWRIG